MTTHTQCTEHFPDFVLDVAVPDGFLDNSWHHDLCPNFIDEANLLQIWIDYADRERREFPEQERFGVYKYASADQFGLVDDAPDSLQTDSWDEVLAFVKKHVAS